MSKLKSHLVILTTLILLFGCVLLSKPSSSIITSVKAATQDAPGVELLPRVQLYPTSIVLRRGAGPKPIPITGIVEILPFIGNNNPHAVIIRPNGPKVTACPVFSGNSYSSTLGTYPVGLLSLGSLPLLEATTNTPLGTGNCGLEYEFYHTTSKGYRIGLGVKTFSIGYTVKDPR